MKTSPAPRNKPKERKSVDAEEDRLPVRRSIFEHGCRDHSCPNCMSLEIWD